MPTLGEVLRDARFRHDVSLEQTEADTKIRKKYLAALEDDDYSSLPPPIYARGFIKTYAEYLGVDPTFAEKLFQPPGRADTVPAIRPAASGLRETRAISLGMVVTFLVVLATIGGVVYLYAQYLSYAASAPAEALTTRATQAVATPTERALPVVVPTAVPTATPLPSPTPVRGVEVVVQVTERCWLRVIADGKSQPIFEGELYPGDTRTWKANDRMDMRVGNAGGVEVTVNGMRQGKLGASGEVKNVTWGRQ